MNEEKKLDEKKLEEVTGGIWGPEAVALCRCPNCGTERGVVYGPFGTVINYGSRDLTGIGDVQMQYGDTCPNCYTGMIVVKTLKVLA